MPKRIHEFSFLCDKQQIIDSNNLILIKLTPTTHNLNLCSLHNILWNYAELFSICFATTVWKIQHMIAQGAWLSGLADQLVCFSSTVQLFSASCYCRRPYSQSNQTSWDTSFPLVILSLRNQRDDDICLGSLTLGSVWTTARTQYTPSHTHKHTWMNTHTKAPPCVPFPPPSLFRQPHVKQHTLLLVLPSSYIYLVQAIPDCHLPDPRPGVTPSPLESVWTQPVMRPPGVKLLRTLYRPSALLMKIFSRMEAGVDQCQHAEKIGPSNCSLALPCCGNDREGN